MNRKLEDATETLRSRELRVWPHKKLLIVTNFRCSSVIHACSRGTDRQFPFDLAFYSLADPVHPTLISTYVPTSAAGLPVKPHEMYLWQDPNNPNRALLWISTPELTPDPTVPNMLIVDISNVPDGGPVTEIAQGNWNGLFENGSETFFHFDLYIHTMAATADGRTTYLSMEGGEMLVLDTSSVVSHAACRAHARRAGGWSTGRPTRLGMRRPACVMRADRDAFRAPYGRTDLVFLAAVVYLKTADTCRWSYRPWATCSERSGAHSAAPTSAFGRQPLIPGVGQIVRDESLWPGLWGQGSLKRERGSVAQGESSLLRSSVSPEEAGRDGCDGRAG